MPESVDITMKGRVTKAVAQMLKAEVVMYQNDESRYAEVLSDMRSIISSQLYSLHDDLLECGKMQANGVKNPFGK